jgi:hypothetical protein
MSKDLSIEFVLPRSYKDALNAGVFTAKPDQYFDKHVCAVGIPLLYTTCQCSCMAY